MNRRFLACLALFVPVPSLASDGPDPAEGDAFLAGGRPVEAGRFPEVVFIRASAGGDVRDCTATVVDPDGRWLLTAARCIPPGTPQDGITAWTGPEGDQSPVASRRWVSHYNWDHDGADDQGYDIAAIELDGEIDAPHLPLNSQEMNAAWLGQDALLVGYGQTASDADDGRTKRLGYASISKLGVDAFPSERAMHDRVFTDDDVGACGADAGGPVLSFRDGAYVQLAILSQSAEPCASAEDGHTRVDVYVGWLTARGVPHETIQETAEPLVCRTLDGTFDFDQDLGVVPFTLRCTAPEGLYAWWMDWGDGVRTDGPQAERRFEVPGSFEWTLVVEGTRSDGEPFSHRVTRGDGFAACAPADAAFSALEIDPMTWRFEAEDTTNPAPCLDGRTWQIFDDQDSLLLESDQATAELRFERAGEYRIVHQVSGFAGDVSAEQRITIEQSTDERSCGCDGTGAPIGWGMMGLLVALGRRRQVVRGSTTLTGGM